MKIKIFDTTLRDGEQTPGVAITSQDKFKVAEALVELGVDIIEAGFPSASEGEEKTVKEISKNFPGKICGLARCTKNDIDACINADVDLIHIFIATSPIHMKFKLKMTEEQVTEKITKSIQYCKDHGFKVHFSLEDATRTEENFMVKICKLADEMKVHYINIPDTVGVCTPERMKQIISSLRKEISTTINGVGERAGNADLEQVVMGCKILYADKFETNIKTEKIYETSKLVERLYGIKISPNFPFVGDNAFAHEAGIHVHGVLAESSTYEPITPEMVGAKRRIVMGKLVGVHAVESKLKELNYDVSNEIAEVITKKIKELGDKGKRVTEVDLMAIADDILGRKREEKIKLADLRVYNDFGKKPFAFVKLDINGNEEIAVSEGVGTVDSALNAIRKIKEYSNVSLEEYHLDAISGGSDALAEVTIKLSNGKKTVIARGIHEDIVMASVAAFINGLNLLE
ncbi:MAG: 2-isopropylmalate synthase [Candidatus Altiarchaeales archaeon HGW-Altiarchaeales-1]|nr:MAG: 2-isopropylmalate synthase [Candidatus Altiarchaeales archaeon HGW-Altiarchaeales-1]